MADQWSHDRKERERWAREENDRRYRRGLPGSVSAPTDSEVAAHGRKMGRIVVGIGALLGLALLWGGCKSVSSVFAYPGNLTGKWTGFYEEEQAAGGALRWRVELDLQQQSDGTVTGTLLVPPKEHQTRLKGRISGKQFTFEETAVVQTAKPQWKLKTAELKYGIASNFWSSDYGFDGEWKDASGQKGFFTLVRAKK